MSPRPAHGHLRYVLQGDAHSPKAAAAGQGPGVWGNDSVGSRQTTPRRPMVALIMPEIYSHTNLCDVGRTIAVMIIVSWKDLINLVVCFPLANYSSDFLTFSGINFIIYDQFSHVL